MWIRSYYRWVESPPAILFIYLVSLVVGFNVSVQAADFDFAHRVAPDFETALR